MARIAWPTHQIAPSLPAEPVPLAECSVNPVWPGQRTVKAEFSNKELTYNVSDSEYAGVIGIPAVNRNSDMHVKVQTFLAQMMEDPQDNWTRLDWQRPSIGMLASTLASNSPLATANNDQIGRLDSVASGVVRLNNIRSGFGDVIAVSEGEHFGYNMKTYKITAATGVLGVPGAFTVRTTPAIPDTTTAADIFKRHFLPTRFQGGQNLADINQGARAGPWSIAVIEARQDG